MQLLRRIRIVHVALAVWTAAFVTYTATVGVPTKRSNVLMWVLLCIAALGVANPRRTLRSLLVDWSPILLALVAYDALRGISDGTRVAHVDPQLAFDRFIGFGTPLTVRLQQHFYDGIHTRWYDYAAWSVYISHFLVPLGIGVLLWAIGSPRFRPYLAGLALLSWMALATYYLYPAQPPWMIARDGLTDPIGRVIHGVWEHVGVERASRVFQPGNVRDTSKYSNPVAALPSLHGAFPMFIFLMLRGVRRWLTVLLAFYPVAMGLALVYSGEHFVFDVLAGWVYALVAATAVAYVFSQFGTRAGERRAAAELDPLHIPPHPGAPSSTSNAPDLDAPLLVN